MVLLGVISILTAYLLLRRVDVLVHLYRIALLDGFNVFNEVIFYMMLCFISAFTCIIANDMLYVGNNSTKWLQLP